MQKTSQTPSFLSQWMNSQMNPLPWLTMRPTGTAISLERLGFDWHEILRANTFRIKTGCNSSFFINSQYPKNNHCHATGQIIKQVFRCAHVAQQQTSAHSWVPGSIPGSNASGRDVCPAGAGARVKRLAGSRRRSSSCVSGGSTLMHTHSLGQQWE